MRFDNLNAQRDERDVYQAVNDARVFFLGIHPELGLFNRRIEAQVSGPQFCGSVYWTGHILLDREGDGCANMSEIMSVAYHEYGHALTEFIYGHFLSWDLDEGNSDVLSNLLTRESAIFRGYYLGNCTEPYRGSDNDMQYPDGNHWQVRVRNNGGAWRTLEETNI